MKISWKQALALLGLIVLMADQAAAQMTLPNIQMGFKTTENPSEIVNTIKIILMLTILTLAPAIMIMMTSFTRFVIVLSFLRQALGVQQMPPNQMLVGLSLFLTFFVMNTTFTEINSKSIQPFLSNQITQEQAIEAGLSPLRKFMLAQTRPSDLGLFVKVAKIQTPKTLADVPTMVLIPAFIISELKTGFQIGFVIFLPFLVIDMLAASVLMAMGMMMLPPVVVSLPLKIMIFVLVDGWALVIGSMVNSFGGS
jgi:flagellar biosynthesis protein FliP